MEKQKSNKNVKPANESEDLKPKRGRSAYILFGMSVRESLVKQSLAAKDIMRKTGELWREASEETKAKFAKMAEEDKAKVEKESEPLSRSQN